ncbi:MAG: hypothetical protein AVDCRST_MAG07-256 [uncultured Frankineae bacterium]|uniref:SCP2 domain-containing protein n=1 Tax=uncultured Frankineae bacterium TaxID=437475 RepID=A0A6J4KKL6_9ACTN|nr:MAG: hypothetical protein AVDCRST_MAG07-256 [uncultured Frankineae bacterium]
MTTPTDSTSYDAAVQRLRSRLTADTLQRIGAVYAFHFEDGTSATLDGRGAHGSGYLEDAPDTLGLTPDFEVTLTREDFAQLVFGELHPMAGMATGRMRLKGSIRQAITLDRLLED